MKTILAVPHRFVLGSDVAHLAGIFSHIIVAIRSGRQPGEGLETESESGGQHTWKLSRIVETAAKRESVLEMRYTSTVTGPARVC